MGIILSKSSICSSGEGVKGAAEYGEEGEGDGRLSAVIPGELYDGTVSEGDDIPPPRDRGDTRGLEKLEVDEDGKGNRDLIGLILGLGIWC